MKKVYSLKLGGLLRRIKNEFSGIWKSQFYLNFSSGYIGVCKCKFIYTCMCICGFPSGAAVKNPPAM